MTGVLVVLVALGASTSAQTPSPCPPGQPPVINLSKPSVVFVSPSVPLADSFTIESIKEDIARYEQVRPFLEQFQRLRADLESKDVAVYELGSGGTQLVYTVRGTRKAYDLSKQPDGRGVIVYCPGSPLEIFAKPIADGALLDRVAKCAP